MIIRDDEDGMEIDLESFFCDRSIFPQPVYSAPSMPECKEPKKTIIFNSQEDFENAVMEVVLKRLGVYNYTESPTGGGSKDYVSTEDLG